jgi:hypothetical protein
MISAIVGKMDERKDIWSSLDVDMPPGLTSWATVTKIAMRPMRSWCCCNTCEISVAMVVESGNCGAEKYWSQHGYRLSCAGCISSIRTGLEAQRSDPMAFGSIYVILVGGRIDNHVTISRTRNQAK